jgi:hypothetical protein
VEAEAELHLGGAGCREWEEEEVVAAAGDWWRMRWTTHTSDERGRRPEPQWRWRLEAAVVTVC